MAIPVIREAWGREWDVVAKRTRDSVALALAELLMPAHLVADPRATREMKLAAGRSFMDRIAGA